MSYIKATDMKLLRIVGQLVLFALVIAVSIFTLSELNFGFAESRVVDALVNKPSRTILIRRTANGDFLDIYKLHQSGDGWDSWNEFHKDR